ncbi:MAG: glycosyltransferase [Flavobacteriales bacterium]|nr:glycosyltransferase [Flavobacteriales bacterium]
MPRILFITQHRPDRSPGQRFRFEQYLGYLEQHGYRCEHSPIVSEGDDKFLYKPGNYFEKARFVRRSHAIRRRDVERMNDFDIIFIFREALMTRNIRFEKLFRQSRAKLVFDFDDAIWLQNVSEANKWFSWIKDAGKTSKLIGLSDLIFAGNAYLADYAKRFNPNTVIVPTTIDTEEYKPVERKGQGPVTIGWSGSITTIQHVRYAIPALKVIKAKYGDRVAIRVVGDGSYREPELGVVGMPWRKDTELLDLGGMDIGIMPLPDDEWARGKCGLKGLQYMALGIPAIMSPVGVNSEIIRDGVNGHLATTKEEWVDRLSRLIDNTEARRAMGIEAKRTVEEHYSVHAWRSRYLEHFNRLIEHNGPNDQRPEADRAHARA